MRPRLFHFALLAAIAGLGLLMFQVGRGDAPVPAKDAGMRHAPRIERLMRDLARNVMDDPVLMTALRQSAATPLTAELMAARDRQWRDEAKPGRGELVDAYLNSAASARLRIIRQPHAPLLADLLLVDAQGVNLALTRLTSDYVQADEPKFRQTFPKGGGTFLLEPAALDESVQDYVVTASLSVADPADGRPLGVLVATIPLDALGRPDQLP